MACVKVYLCTNPEDSVVERRALKQTVFPRLREHCRQKHGVDFRVIDPYEGRGPHDWPSQGVRQQLLEECRRSSVGPFFVALVGERYGTTCLPEQVEVSEFQQVLQVCQCMELRTHAVEQCYHRDENTIPPSFCLINHNAYVRQNGHQGQQDREERGWLEVAQEASKTLHAAVSQCLLEGSLARQAAQKYFRSGLDNDIRFAVESSSGIDVQRCLCYVHKVITEKQQKKTSTEVSLGEHPGSHDLLSQLCDQFLPSLDASCQPLVYTTTTVCKGKQDYSKEMRHNYARALCQQLRSDLLGLIDRTVNRGLVPAGNRLSYHEDICSIYSNLYRTERADIQHVKGYLERKDTRSPLVLIGGPCTGKTVLLAHCASQVKEWLKDIDPVVIIVFANFYSSLKDFLEHLCRQIALKYNHPCNTCLKSISGLKDYLSKLMVSVSSFQEPLVLLIDGLDQLPNRGAPLDISWLPRSLPTSVTLVISTTPTKSRILSALQRHYPSSHHFLELEPIGGKSCGKMLSALLQTSNRNITSGQQIYVNLAFKRCPLPLCVELIHRQVCLWTSESEVSERSLTPGVHANIGRFLDQLEECHGKIIVSRALGYLTLSRNGLTEAELTDVLSCDDKVLSNFLPCGNSIPHKLRVPEVVLERLLLDLQGFLIVAKVFGSSPLNWVSRHFPLVIHKRYLCSTELKRDMHHVLADYFSGVWAHGRAKPFCISPHPVIKSDVIPPKKYIDRQPPGQPWIFGPSQLPSETSRMSRGHHVNLRKVLELPFHLKESGRLEELGGVMKNLEYHQALLEAKLIEELVSCLEEMSQVVFPEALALFAGIFRNSACLLRESPDDITLVMQMKLFPFLQVFPELEEYAEQIRRKAARSSGVNALVPPTASVPSTCWGLPKEKSTIAHVAESNGTLLVILDNSSVWTWTDSEPEGFEVPHSSELQPTGVSGIDNVFLLSTQSNKLFIWDTNVSSGVQEVKMLKSKKRQYTCLCVEGGLMSGDILVVWWKKRNYVSVVNAVKKVEMSRLLCHQEVTCVASSVDGCYVYCGLLEGAVRIFETISGCILATFTCSACLSLRDLVVLEDERDIACIDCTGSVFFWDVENITGPQLVKECISLNGRYEVLNTDFSQENNKILICKKHQIFLWDTQRLEVEDQLNAPWRKSFIKAMLDQDCHFILALLEDCPSVLVWNWATGQCVLNLDPGNSKATELLKLGGTHVAAVTKEQVIIWDLDLITVAASSPKSGTRVKQIVAGTHGEHIYSTDGTELVWKWRAQSGKVEGQFLHPGLVETMTLSVDGEYLVTIALEDIYVWRTSTSENLHQICGSLASDILITPKSNFAVSLSERGPSRVWKLGTGRVVCSIHLSLSDAVISPESTFIFGLNKGNLLAVSLWSGYVSKRFLRSRESSVLAFHAVAEHPDYIVVVTTTGALYSWKLSEETICQQIQLLGSSLCEPEIFKLSSDGRYALLSVSGSSITILDIAKGKLCIINTEGVVQQTCLDISGRCVVYTCCASVRSRCCSCELNASPVLIAVRVSDGKTIGKFYLGLKPSALCLSKNLSVYVGFDDGSVGVFSVNGKEHGISNARVAPICPDKGFTCPFNTPLIVPPLPSPNLMWTEAAADIL